VPDWTRAEIRVEAKAHGFFMVEDSRVNGMIQRAVDDLINEAQWPFQMRAGVAVTSGSAVADLGKVEQVRNAEGEPLVPAERDWLYDRYYDLTTEGAPVYYWQQATGDGYSGLIHSYPVAAEALSADYFSNYGWTSDGSDFVATAASDAHKPRVPSRFRDLPLILTRIHLLEDSDRLEDSQMVRSVEYEPRLEVMRSELLHRQVDEQRRVVVTDGNWA
jgi:hypothetical protein